MGHECHQLHTSHAQHTQAQAEAAQRQAWTNALHNVANTLHTEWQHNSEQARAQQQAMVRAIDANGLRPVVDKHFELEQIVDAFRYQESNRHFGKICLTW